MVKLLGSRRILCLAISCFYILSSVIFPTNIAAAEVEESALTLAKQARALAQKSQYEPALGMANEALKLAEREYGRDHEYTAYLLDDVATYHLRLGRPKKALSFSTDAVKIVGRRKGTDSPEYAKLASNLGTILLAAGRLKESETQYALTLNVYQLKLQADDARLGSAYRNLGIVYQELALFTKAIDHFRAAAGIYSKTRQRHRDELLEAYLDLAQTYLRINNRFAARQYLEKVQDEKLIRSDTLWVKLQLVLSKLDIAESNLDLAQGRIEDTLQSMAEARRQNENTRASLLYNLGFIYILQGKLVEAEPLYKQLLGLYRKTVSEDHPAIARTLHSLAIVYKNLGRYSEAEQYYEQAIRIFSRGISANSAPVGATRLEYSLLYSHMGYADAAEMQSKKAIAIYESLEGNWALQKGYANASLGFALFKDNRLDEAAASFEKATRLVTEARGRFSSDLPPGLIKLAEINMALGKPQQAEEYLKWAISILEKDNALTPYGLAKALSVKAKLRKGQKDYAAALRLADQYLNIIKKRLSVNQHSSSESSLDELRESRILFEEYVDTAFAYKSQAQNRGILQKIFLAAQYPQLSGTAAAVSKMAARFSAQDSALGVLVRKREESIEKWRHLDNLLTKELGGIESATKTQDNAPLKERAIETFNDIQQFDALLQKEFPDYAELTNPQPIDLRDVQKLLRKDEAIFSHLTTEHDTFVLLVRRKSFDVLKTVLSKAELERAVKSIRKGVDLKNIRSVGDIPPFDAQAAYDLYKNLFEPFEKQLSGVRHLITILDGAMQNIPPALLLERLPKEIPVPISDYRNLDYFGRKYPISVVPSISAFAALRAVIKPSRSTEPFVGFGDPDLDGTKADTRGNVSDMVEQLTLAIDPGELRSRLAPLPETRLELQTLSKTLNATPDSLFFRDRATETRVKDMDLARYRVIAFATHGLLAGEFRGLAEPALVLTPPAVSKETDNGLLTSSEIANLNLDSDWVILSACNTAGPAGRPGAEGLSGLAKAFFYAGSRALLVSHWAVSSDTSVLITTGTLEAMAANPAIGRAGALRQSVLKMIEGKPEIYYAHPAFWAPFTVVGEGGAVN